MLLSSVHGTIRRCRCIVANLKPYRNSYRLNISFNIGKYGEYNPHLNCAPFLFRLFFFNSKQFICGIDFQFPMIMYTNGRFDVYVWLCELFEMRVFASGFVLFLSINDRKTIDESIWWLCGYFLIRFFFLFVYSLLSKFLIQFSFH